MLNHLENLRKKEGISQEEFAKKLGVTRQTIISLEKCRYNPSLELAFKISRFFKMPIEEIFIYERSVENEKED